MSNGPQINFERPDSLIGAELKNYRVLSFLGRGQFGIVFQVADTGTGELLAAKVILRQDVDKKEITALSKLNHRNIVRLRETFDYLLGTTVIIEEYCDDGSLREVIEKSRVESHFLEETTVLKWCVEMLEALEFMHSKNIIHRDMKPDNIFLAHYRGRQVVKVGDFGTSRIFNDDDSMQTRSHIGSPSYMAPEIFKETGASFNCDVWSLGVVLYELCTLARLFSAESMVGIMHKIVFGSPEVPKLPCQFSPQLYTLIQSMLQREPSERPQAKELLDTQFLLDFVAELGYEEEEDEDSFGSTEAAGDGAADLSVVGATMRLALRPENEDGVMPLSEEGCGSDEDYAECEATLTQGALRQADSGAARYDHTVGDSIDALLRSSSEYSDDGGSNLPAAGGGVPGRLEREFSQESLPDLNLNLGDQTLNFGDQTLSADFIQNYRDLPRSSLELGGGDNGAVPKRRQATSALLPETVTVLELEAATSKKTVRVFSGRK